MTLAELCEATITLSDNTAGNLILEAIGGPQGLTGFLRTIGDEVTRLDRWEPELNESSPGDARDTTSPNAMANTIQTLLFTDALSAAARLQLETWLRGNAVGDALLRAAIPENWSIGDKTGAGGFGSPSIAAVLWPPQRGPIIAAIYITETDATFGERNAAIAAIGLAISRSVLAP
jgi:beta-lactamase class A/beta-lactamase class A CARB-5